ncbi:MAG: cation:dicarboxylase symporter family transporter [Lachnospiraceae bacterium]|nr:cation:dicarboxylase symporter family transporter [Lachnospiraceae bacterium]
MSTNEQAYSINESNIERMSEQINEYMSGLDMDPGIRYRIQFAMDELLLRIADHFGNDKEVGLRMGRQFGSPVIIISFMGERFDPTDDAAAGIDPDNAMSAWERNILVNIGVQPVYQYRNGVNIVRLRLRRQGNTMLRNLAIAIVLAVVLGVAGQFLLPEGAKTFISESLLKPLFDAFLGILSTIACMMIFLSIATGIGGIDDLQTLGLLGKKVLTRFLLMTFGAGVVTAVIGRFLFSLSAGAAEGSSGVEDIIGMVLAMLPGDPVTPFLNCDFMQIIILGGAVGIAVLILGGQMETLHTVLIQADQLIQFIMEKVCSAIPILVFILLSQQIISGEVASYLKAWKPLLIFAGIGVIFLMVEVMAVSLRFKIPLGRYLKKTMSCFITGLTTASAVAVFTMNMETCEKKLGVKKKLTAFGVPMGNVLYMPMSAVGFMLAIYYMAEFGGVPVPIAWIIMAAFVSGILALAMPPIPGGSLTCYGIIVSQLGIPADCVAVVTGLALLFDFMATAVNVATLQTELVRLAGDMEMLDTEVLLAEQEK